MEHKSDFLVIGSGVAGLLFALKVAEFGTVSLVTKKKASESNTNYAQGGIAGVFGSLDSFDQHIEDTLSSGDGLCNREVVDRVVKEGPDRIRELIDLGVSFNIKGNDFNYFRRFRFYLLLFRFISGNIDHVILVINLIDHTNVIHNLGRRGPFKTD